MPDISKELSWDLRMVHQHVASLRGLGISQDGSWVLRGSIPGGSASYHSSQRLDLEAAQVISTASYWLSSHSAAPESRMGQINLDGESDKECAATIIPPQKVRK